jgi:signal peptidase II
MKMIFIDSISELKFQILAFKAFQLRFLNHMSKAKKTAKKLFFYGVAVAFFTAVFDLMSKQMIFSILENIASTQNIDNPEIKIFDFFSLVYVWNYGVSFGMFSELEGSWIIFSVIQFLIIITLFFWLHQNTKPHFSWALGLVIGGAFGNLIDRLKNGAVADFLDFHIASYHWPAFNLADSCIFIGVVILLFDEVIFPKKTARKS